MDEFRHQGGSIREVISHGRILARPLQPAGAKNNVAYILGACFQLDKTHCLLAANMEKQGGHDMSVGNDGFVFERLSDITAEKAIPLNRPDEHYKLRYKDGHAWLAKFPILGGFIPLGAKLEDGRPHPAAGTGVLLSDGMTFNRERTTGGKDSELVTEVMQVRWDGQSLDITQRSYMDEAMGLRLCGLPMSCFCPQDAAFLVPLTTNKGTVVFRWEFDGNQWLITDCGEPFMTHTKGDWVHPVGEIEPTLQKHADEYLVYTRGWDPVGRVYRSNDGMNYKLWFERKNQTLPQVLNRGLDGSLYLATNPNWDMLRNPLVAHPMQGQSFGEPILIHDQGGIRDDQGPQVPFIDHAIGVNLFLEGRWRHLLWYRVCDLRERTFHTEMDESEWAKGFREKWGEPVPLRETDGLYMAELAYDQATCVPSEWF